LRRDILLAFPPFQGYNNLGRYQFFKKKGEKKK